MLYMADVFLKTGLSSPIRSLQRGTTFVSLTFSHGACCVIAFSPHIKDADRRAIEEPVFSVGMLVTKQNPVGIISLVLGGHPDHQEHWILSAPFVDFSGPVRRSAAPPVESDQVYLLLVNSNTDIIASARALTVPKHLIEEIWARSEAIIMDLPADTEVLHKLPRYVSREILKRSRSSDHYHRDATAFVEFLSMSLEQILAKSTIYQLRSVRGTTSPARTNGRNEKSRSP